MARTTPTLEEIEAVFLALSHEARRHILLMLSHLGGELSSGYLATRFEHSWPTTTRHLGVLEQAGLVEGRREGRGSHYRINREKLIRVVEGWLKNLDEAAAFYAKLLGYEGKRHPGSRHYFDCGGVILAVLDPTAGGLTPTPNPKSLYFAVKDLEAVHARATALKALAPYKVHGEPAGASAHRTWGERAFSV